MNGLMERFPKNRVGFIKPVGQQSVVVSVTDEGVGQPCREIMVDKKSCWIHQTCWTAIVVSIIDKEEQTIRDIMMETIFPTEQYVV